MSARHDNGGVARGWQKRPSNESLGRSMMRMHRKAVLLALLAMPVGVWAMGKGHLDPGSCPTDVGAALAARCPCDGQKNHGQYVSCVVRFRNALRKAGCLSVEERRTIARCAARST